MYAEVLERDTQFSSVLLCAAPVPEELGGSNDLEGLQLFNVQVRGEGSDFDVLPNVGGVSRCS